MLILSCQRSLPFVFCLLMLSLTSIAQGTMGYGVDKISHALQEVANVIIRQEQTTFRVQSRSKAQLQVQKAMTIMNEEGSVAVPFYLYYDPHRRITNLSADIYNAAGKPVAHINAEQFGDYPAVQEAPSFEQNRFKIFSFATDQYPYTIAYRYTVDIDGLYRYPNWNPVRTEGVAVEAADFQLMIPDSLDFRYKAYNLGDVPKITATPGGKQYHWSVRDHSPVVSEPLGPEFYEITPSLQLFPKNFSYDGVDGSTECWKTFGSWVYGQLVGGDSISDATRREILSLTGSTAEISQKIRLVRDYVHTRLRYIALPLGIGSYQPMCALCVEEAGYGDSKALANYTKALLKVAGIRAHYALINAGKFATAIERDLPGAQFSHALLAVPLAGDTLWLDCTDPHRPIGYPGYLLSGRDVLLITENGGELVRTPSYRAEDNLQARRANVRIEENGRAVAELVTRFAGLQYAHISPLLLLTAAQQEEVIYQKTALPSFSVEGYRYFSRPDKNPVLEEKLSLCLESFGSSSGNLLHFNPNLMNQMDGLPPVSAKRQHRIEVKKSFLDVDTIIYELPEGMQVRQLPEDVKIDSEFGEYQVRIKQDGEKIQYIRYLKTNKGHFPASAYSDLQKFYEEIIFADQRKVILESTYETSEKAELLKPGGFQ